MKVTLVPGCCWGRGEWKGEEGKGGEGKLPAFLSPAADITVACFGVGFFFLGGSATQLPSKSYMESYSIL